MRSSTTRVHRVYRIANRSDCGSCSVRLDMQSLGVSLKRRLLQCWRPKEYRAPATSAIYYVSSAYARGTISSAYYSVESCTDYITLSSRRNSVWQSEWCTVLLQQAPPGCTTQAVFGAYCSDFYGFTLWYLTHV